LDRGLYGSAGVLIARSRVIHRLMRQGARTMRRCAILVRGWTQ
jgi:hypothetical protein